MADYDFSTLNSSDLEELVADLLNAREKDTGSGKTYKTFKAGADGGVDLLLSTGIPQNDEVGQVKHYAQTGFNGLYHKLKEEELDKVRKLNPSKYIFATSIDLSPEQTEKIVQLFSPYIHSKHDVLGRKDLNRLLDDFPRVSENHYKLWFSSAAILSRLTQYYEVGKAGEFIENRLKKRIRLYVENSQLRQAKAKLEQKNMVILSGEPGVGKTAMAEMLLYEYIKDGYQLIYVSDSIKEVDKFLNASEKKYVFYFDDFLGHTQKEIDKARESESYLLKIFQKLKWSANKKLIFTTRTFILKAAVESSEQLRRANIDAQQSTVALEGYNTLTRIQMLKNHAEESVISSELKAVLQEDDVINFIVYHEMFYPRSLEFITNEEIVGDLSPDDFRQYIYDNFNKPDEIWRHAYEQQISNIDRFFLNTLLSFGYATSLADIENAFLARIDYEVQYNNLPRPQNSFNQSFKRLVGGFVAYEKEHGYLGHHITFINPSLVDFLTELLKNDRHEIIRIAESAIYSTQLYRKLYYYEGLTNDLSLPQRLLDRLLNGAQGFLLVDPDVDRLTFGLLLVLLGLGKEQTNAGYYFLSSIENWTGFLPPDLPIHWWRALLENPPSQDFISLVEHLGKNVFHSIVKELTSFEDIKEWEQLMKEKYGLSMINLLNNGYELEWDLQFTEILHDKVVEVANALRRGEYHTKDIEEAKRDIIKTKAEMELLGARPDVWFDIFHDLEIENEDSE